MTKTYFSWSTGKDAALAYYHLRSDNRYHVDRLVTSVNAHYDRVSMHGLSRELLLKQTQAIGLPVTTIELPEEPTMEVYDAELERVAGQLQAEGYGCCGFGDIFLEDLRAYRKKQLAPFDIECRFPLWQRDTRELMEEFLGLGFKAIVVCVNADVLGESFVGREIDGDFVKDLPAGVDPCGENGEFHTFCYDGPIFTNPVSFVVGEKVYREYGRPKEEGKPRGERPMGFWFCDLK